MQFLWLAVVFARVAADGHVPRIKVSGADVVAQVSCAVSIATVPH